MMLNPEETVALLNAIEAEVDVAAWSLGDIKLWPLARMSIGYGAFGPTGHSESSTARFSRLNFLHELPSRLWAPLAHAPRKPEVTHSAEVVILGDAVSRVCRDGQSWDRLCGPFVRILESMGISCFLIEPSYGTDIPYRESTLPIQYAIDRAFLWARALHVFTPQAPHIPGHRRVLELVQQAGVNTRPIEKRALQLQALQLRLLADFFGRVLESAGARLGFLVDWNIPTMAFNLACAKRGIPSVEIQHGVISRSHWAYGGWFCMPPDGFKEIPAYFWCWELEDAEVISEWASRTSRHSAVTGGDLWAREWRLGHLDDPSDEEMLKQAKGRREGGVDILVTLQWGLISREDILPIVEAARSSGQEFRWWIRSHPLMTESETRSALSLFPEEAQQRAEIATRVLLFQLLQGMDVHVTHSSSAALDAAKVGVPSILVGQGFETLFAERSLPFLYATDGDTLLRHLKERSWSTAPSGVRDIDPQLVIGQLVGWKEAPRQHRGE